MQARLDEQQELVLADSCGAAEEGAWVRNRRWPMDALFADTPLPEVGESGLEHSFEDW